MYNWMQTISEEIFRSKYMLHGENSVEEVFEKIADEIASAETSNREKIKSDFYESMISGKLIPAGRILANARPGSNMKNYNNCFTIDIEDSMEGIFDSLKEDAMISKMGGGVGFDISKLRPKNSNLSMGGESSGVISFLRIFDQSAKTIMTGGQRRSAHIALLDISHPDIEEFITVKQGENNKELTQFNISVKISDEFIHAVENDKDWDLVFQGKIYKTVKARYLYDLLAKNSFIHNEPGIFNSDKIEKYNNGYWAFKLDRVNPCGEIVMPAYSLCCLSAVNLSKFIVNAFEDDAYFDYLEFEKYVKIGVRFLDNVLDKTDYPLEKIKLFSKKWRRIGLGFTGLGDALAMMKIPYGSEKSIETAGKIAKALRDYSYSASSDLAAEKGSFPEFDKDKFLEAEFVKLLPQDIRSKITVNGIRNIQLNTVAPTGTISLSVGQNCSSGIEPIFSLEYKRTIRTGVNDDTRTENVYDYAWLLYKKKFGDNADVPDYFTTTLNIDPYKSIDFQAEVQKYIDHSISKTLNLPLKTTFEEYKQLYMYAYKKGVKGFTTFNPEGSMKGILEYNDSAEKKNIVRRFAPERPESVECEIHTIENHVKNYIIITGFFNGSLYEIFCIDDNLKEISIPDGTKGTVKKIKSGHYNLLFSINGKECIIENITKQFDSPDASLARLVSMALRHGTPIQFIINQLNKDSNFVDFERVVSRVLKKYLKDGEEVISGKKLCESCSAQLVFKDGCVVCPDCGWSTCA
ncbi:MAG: adenosylcobalamin-dependent ribonucleoside-diphosphate reductase [Spirochaetes bacterium]|nr:adenosylcobalamin-dependent ribonucleoside-diphosphate reductase [Spirochaetota bacterium]